MIKNIEDMIIYKVEDDGELLQIDGVPQYNELLSKNRTAIFTHHFHHLKDIRTRKSFPTKYLEELYYDLGIIGQDTPKKIMAYYSELNNFP